MNDRNQAYDPLRGSIYEHPTALQFFLSAADKKIAERKHREKLRTDILVKAEIIAVDHSDLYVWSHADHAVYRVHADHFDLEPLNP